MRFDHSASMIGVDGSDEKANLQRSSETRLMSAVHLATDAVLLQHRVQHIRFTSVGRGVNSDEILRFHRYDLLAARPRDFVSVCGNSNLPKDIDTKNVAESLMYSLGLVEPIQVLESADDQRIAGNRWRGIHSRVQFAFGDFFVLSGCLQHHDIAALAEEIQQPIRKQR